MPGATLSTIDSILKDRYLGPIREQLNNELITLKRLRRNSEDIDFSGRQAIVPLHMGRNKGVGARAEGAALPSPGAQGYKDMKIKMAYNYATIKITGPSIKAARNNAGAFIRTVSSEVKGAVRDLKRECNRQFYNGTYGEIAVCGDTSGSTTVQLDTKTNMNLFEVGDRIDIATIATGDKVSNGDSVTIESIDRDNCTITISGDGVTTSNTHGIFREDAYGQELKGLVAWLGTADNTLGNINRAENPWFNPNIMSNAGTLRALSLDLMQQAFDETEIAIGSNGVSAGYTNHALRRKYLALVRADRRYVNQMTLDGGFKAVEYNGVPLILDTMGPRHSIFFCDESMMQTYEMSDFEWMQEDGAVLSRALDGSDAYEAVLFWYSQLGCSVPRASTFLTDLIEA